MKNPTAFLLLLSFLLLIGCIEDSSLVDWSEPTTESADELVIKNCNTVQQAAKDFAAQNNGVYPVHTDSDTTLLGNTLIDLLPNGERLENPYTHAMTEPINGIADNPGETGYDGYGHIYVISGFGSDSLIVILNNVEELEDTVIANCLVVQQAVEEWAAQNNDVYPGCVGWDFNLEGNTVIDLLPGGVRLVNPFTRCASEPVDGHAANPGETAYVPQMREGVNIGYVITGMGHTSGPSLIVISKP